MALAHVGFGVGESHKMDWKKAIHAFRAHLGHHLRGKGFVRKRGVWVRQGEHWRHEFAVEIVPSRKVHRRVMAFAELTWAVQLQGEDAAMVGANLPGYDVWKHFTLRPYPSTEHVEVILEHPEFLRPLADEWIKRLDEEWLPWMKTRDTEDRSDAHSHIEHWHISFRGQEM